MGCGRAMSPNWVGSTVEHDQLASSNATPVERIYWLLEDAALWHFALCWISSRWVYGRTNVAIISIGWCVLCKQTTMHLLVAYPQLVSKWSEIKVLDKTTFRPLWTLETRTYDILSPRYDEAPEQYFD